MKRLFVFTLIFLGFYLALSKTAYAGGTCTAKKNSLGVCAIDTDNCDADTPRCNVITNRAGVCSTNCTKCNSKSNCSRFGSTKACNTSSGKCVQCTASDTSACDPTSEKCDTLSNTCKKISCVLPGNKCSASGPPCCTTGSATYACTSIPAGYSVCSLTSAKPKCQCKDDGKGCSKGKYCDTSIGEPVSCEGVGSLRHLCFDLSSTEPQYRCSSSFLCQECATDDTDCTTLSTCQSNCADTTTPPSDPNQPLDPASPFPKPKDPEGVIKAAAFLLIPIAIILGLLRAIQGSYLVMTCQGNETQLQEGKEIITSAVVGVIMAVAGLGILSFILTTFID